VSGHGPGSKTRPLTTRRPKNSILVKDHEPLLGRPEKDKGDMITFSKKRGSTGADYLAARIKRVETLYPGVRYENFDLLYSPHSGSFDPDPPEVAFGTSEAHRSCAKTKEPKHRTKGTNVNILSPKAAWRRAPEYLRGPSMPLCLDNSAESRLNRQGKMSGPMTPLANSVRTAGPARTPLSPLHSALRSPSVSSEPNETWRRNLEALATQLVARCGNDPRRMRDMARNYERGGVIWNCLTQRADELEPLGPTGEPGQNLTALANRLCANKSADQLFQLGHQYPKGSTIRKLALERARQKARQPLTAFGAGV
jgi:hypothetical protein